MSLNGTSRVGRDLCARLALLPIVLQLACSDHAVRCDDYACVNTATMVGSVAIPEGVRAVNVEYCNERACIGGSMDLAEIDESACSPEASYPEENGFCVTPTAAGELKVEASLRGPDNLELPADGEEYSLAIMDRDSKDVLVEVKREADYRVTREDECHLCWTAEMAF